MSQRVMWLLLYLLFGWGGVEASETTAKIHIALAGPLEGVGRDVGTGMARGIELYLEEINRRGGVQGREVVIDRYNDGNQAKQAAQVAQQIIDDGRAVAVIGHWYSSCSIPAGAIYKANRIPAVSPGATNNRVTLDNDWYFRTIFNDSSQGSYLAHYAVSALVQQRVTVIHEQLEYGAFLGQIFAESATKLGATVDQIIALHTQEPMAQQAEQIAATIKARGSEAGLIFLALHAPEAIAVVRAFREAGVTNLLMGPDAISSVEFRDGFRERLAEQRHPGYYSNGIYVTAPINFDAANEEAQQFLGRYRKRYNEEPGWNAVYAYDTIKVLVAALEVKPLVEDLAANRAAVREALAAINSPELAVKGATGLNYFDANGDADKPVAVARYSNNTLISSMTHYTPVANLTDVTDLEGELQSGRIVQVNHHYLYKKSMVYTGIKIHKIGPYEPNQRLVTLDFTLWFRYRGDFNPAHIELLNALTPIPLGEPIQSLTEEGVSYRSYRVKGEFRSNLVNSRVPLGEHTLGIALRNRDYDRNRVVYVSDLIGMGLIGGQRLLERLKSSDTVIDLNGWGLIDAAIFEDILRVDTLGNPNYLHNQDAAIPFSRFQFVLYLKRSEITLRGALPLEWIEPALALSGSLLLLLVAMRWMRRVKVRRYGSYSSWLVKLLALLLLLISSEMWLIDHYLPQQDPFKQQLIIRGFDMLWWWIPAYLFNDALGVFFWQTLERSRGRQIPGVVRGIVAMVIYTLAIFAIVAFVFDEKLTGLLATSGLVAMIIGLAIQVNLSNIFSGIALNLERPFRVGDWVKVGEHEEGRVIDVTWRATRLQTRSNHLISIPNSPVAEAAIVNFSYNDHFSRISLMVGVEPHQSVAEVKRLLNHAALAVADVLQQPPPLSTFEGVSGGVGHYSLAFSVADYGDKGNLREQVWANIVRYFEAAGVQLVTELSRVTLKRELSNLAASSTFNWVQLLRRVALFNLFPDSLVQELATVAIVHSLTAGKRFIQQGEVGNSIYIVADGVISIYWREGADGQELEVGRLGCGEALGGYAALSGQPRSASAETLTDAVLFEIKQEALEPLLEAYPAVREQIRSSSNEQVSHTRERADEFRRQQEADTNLMTRIWRGMGRIYSGGQGDESEGGSHGDGES